MTIFYFSSTFLSEHASHFVKCLIIICSKFIQDVIDRRRKIVSGSLTQKNLKLYCAHLAQTIDIGNHLLGLDLVVRDENQNIDNSSGTVDKNIFI